MELEARARVGSNFWVNPVMKARPGFPVTRERLDPRLNEKLVWMSCILPSTKRRGQRSGFPPPESDADPWNRCANLESGIPVVAMTWPVLLMFFSPSGSLALRRTPAPAFSR